MFSIFFITILKFVTARLTSGASQEVKNLPAKVGLTTHECSVPGLGRSPERGNGNLL